MFVNSINVFDCRLSGVNMSLVTVSNQAMLTPTWSASETIQKTEISLVSEEFKYNYNVRSLLLKYIKGY